MDTLLYAGSFDPVTRGHSGCYPQGCRTLLNAGRCGDA